MPDVGLFILPVLATLIFGLIVYVGVNWVARDPDKLDPDEAADSKDRQRGRRPPQRPG